MSTNTNIDGCNGKLVVPTIEEIQRQLSNAAIELPEAKNEATVKTWIERISAIIVDLHEYPQFGDYTNALYEAVEGVKMGDKTRNDITVAIANLVNAILAFSEAEKEKKEKAERMRELLLVMADNVEVLMALIDKK